MAPENTLEAFQAAADCGADGVELDVQLTRDGEVVVIHDERVDRVAGGLSTGWVKDFTLKELQAIDVSKARAEYSWFTNAQDCRIPTLREVLELIEPTGMEVNIEFKTSLVNYDDPSSGEYTDVKPGHIVEKTFAIVSGTGMSGRVVYSSFNHYTVRRVHELRPEVPCAPLFDEVLADPWEYAATLGAKGIHPDYHTLIMYPDYVDRCHDAGIAVRAWTVDDPTDIAELIRQDTDVIITNEPDVALRVE